MAVDFPDMEAQLEDVIEAIAEGGQFYAFGDKQFKRADIATTFEILKVVAHQNARLTTNNGFGLAAF